MVIESEILEQFEIVNPTAAAMLSILDTSGLSLCTAENGEQTLRDNRQKPKQYLHCHKNPSKEAKEWSQPIIAANPSFLVIFGIGLGWHWKELQPWLQKRSSRRLIVIEDDLAVISYFLQTPLAAAFFSDPQSTLLYINGEEEKKQAFQILSWNSYKERSACVASPAYTRYRNDLFDHLFTELTTEQIDTASVLNEFFTFGEDQLHNFGRNAFLWKKSKNGSSLFGAFKGVPAIIVGAGPSLDHEIDLLKTIGPKALILSGGSSIGALLQSGVIPHFAATVDPNPAQYLRLRQSQAFCLPTFYRSRALYEALMNQKGPLFYLRGGDGYPIVEWFEEKLGIDGPVLDGGNSVTNMILEIAHALGCDPIIMVGYDLAYSGGNLYSQHITESLSAKESTKFSGSTRGELITGKGIRGPVLTEAKWMIEAKWIEEFQKRHPECSIINTAMEGLFLNGISAMQLEEALSLHCKERFDIEALSHLAIEEAKTISCPNEQIVGAIKDICTSLQQCKNLFESLAAHLDSGESLSSFHIVRHLIDLESQEAYQHVLLPFVKMHEKLGAMKQLLECRPLTDQTKIETFQKTMLRKRCHLLTDACVVHLRFFFSCCSWAFLNGQILPGALHAVPWPEHLSRKPACLT
jgi:hypothetical protein